MNPGFYFFAEDTDKRNLPAAKKSQLYAFWSSSIIPAKAKAGRRQQGEARHQPNQSKIPSSCHRFKWFYNVFSQRYGRLHLLSDQEPSPLWSQPLNVSVSSLIPFLNSTPFSFPFCLTGTTFKSQSHSLYTLTQQNAQASEFCLNT